MAGDIVHKHDFDFPAEFPYTHEWYAPTPDQVTSSGRPEDKTVLVEPKPLLEEGDLSPAFVTTSNLLSENLPRQVVVVNKETPAEISGTDLEFYKNAAEVARILGGRSTYFIVDVGHKHLPGIATAFEEHGIRTAFYLTKDCHPWFKMAAKYWAGRLTMAKAGGKLGAATLVDAHRKEDLPDAAFPDPKALKKSGIKKVIILTEARSWDEIPLNFFSPESSKETFRLIAGYRDAGFEVKGLGIDPRGTPPITHSGAQEFGLEISA